MSRHILTYTDLENCKNWLKENLSEERYEHSLGTADAAAKLAPNTYWLFDGVHPTVAGHQLIAEAWMNAAGKLLGK